MVKTCSIKGCKSRGQYVKDDDLKFFTFPKFSSLHKELREKRAKWAEACGRIDKVTGKAWRPPDGVTAVYVCSEHFIEGRPSSDSYHPDYVPSLLLPGKDLSSGNHGEETLGRSHNHSAIENEQPSTSLAIHADDVSISRGMAIENQYSQTFVKQEPEDNDCVEGIAIENQYSQTFVKQEPEDNDCVEDYTMENQYSQIHIKQEPEDNFDSEETHTNHCAGNIIKQEDEEDSIYNLCFKNENKSECVEAGSQVEGIKQEFTDKTVKEESCSPNHANNFKIKDSTEFKMECEDIDEEDLNSDPRETCQSPGLVNSDVASPKAEEENVLEKNTRSCPPEGKLCTNKSLQQSDYDERKKANINCSSFGCNICGRKFSRSSNFVVHMRTHTGEKPYKCKICKKQFSKKCAFLSHEKTHVAEKVYDCQICYKKYIRRSDFVNHMKNHSRGEEYYCNICKKKFSQGDHLIDHMRTHTKEKLYTCTICPKSFTCHPIFLAHMEFHTSKKPYIPPKSLDERMNFRISSKSKKQLTAHTATHTSEKPMHTSEKPFTCTVCAMSFSCNTIFLAHMRAHASEKPYTPPKSLAERMNMQTFRRAPVDQHKAAHTGGILYKCPTCKVHFTQLQPLIFHMRTHTGEIWYNCLYCTNIFTKRGDLLSHLKTHPEGQDSHSCCHICGKLLHTGSLVSHLKTQH